jgi:hypothetical protein
MVAVNKVRVDNQFIVARALRNRLLAIRGAGGSCGAHSSLR